jgi:hypothetical protein
MAVNISTPLVRCTLECSCCVGQCDGVAAQKDYIFCGLAYLRVVLRVIMRTPRASFEDITFYMENLILEVVFSTS